MRTMSSIYVAAGILIGMMSPAMAQIRTAPDDPCQEFSSDACKRIQTQVNAKSQPTYCKPGFSIAGDPARVALSDEQLRVCYTWEENEWRKGMSAPPPAVGQRQ